MMTVRVAEEETQVDAIIYSQNASKKKLLNAVWHSSTPLFVNFDRSRHRYKEEERIKMLLRSMLVV
jgi:hypothetical protein